MAQPTLIAIGERSTSCELCGRKLGPMRRCRICGKGEWPRPGTPCWDRWTRGLIKTVRARLEAQGLRAAIFPTLEAVFFDIGEVPGATRPLVADILSMPCSPRRYQRAESWGVSPKEAEARSENLADVAVEYLDERRVTRELGLRIDVAARMRIAAVDEDLHEEEVEEEAPARRFANVC